MIIRHQSFIRGTKLMNRNGRKYEVLADTRNDRTLVCSFGCKYPFVCVACSINQYDDGRIDWEHSEQVGFWADLIWMYGTRSHLVEMLRKEGTI